MFVGQQVEVFIEAAASAELVGESPEKSL